MREAITPIVAALLSGSAACLCAAQASADSQSPAAAALPTAAAQAPDKSVPPMPQMLVRPPVRLNGPADLEHLRETNFYHYLRAKKILAAANEICAPKPAHTYRTRFSAADPQCGAMWMTSLPPKKQLSFHLDGVYYVALVTVTNLAAKPIPVLDAPPRAHSHQ